MFLVDTSVWIDHFRGGNQTLASLLENDQVMIHSAIIGELACGNLKPRTETLFFLMNLPRVEGVTLSEILLFIDLHRLFGKGLSFTDIHILASALLAKVNLLTIDKNMKNAFERLA